VIRASLLPGVFYWFLAAAAVLAEEKPQFEFYFTRGIYSDDFSMGDIELGGSWSIDYPRADRHFLYAIKRLSIIDASPDENSIKLTAPELADYPLIYVLEAGAMQLTEPEVEALRHYLLAGGFLFIDDSWGSWAWETLVEQLGQVLPEYPVVDLQATHPIFHVLYDIDEIIQVPNYRNGLAFERLGVTHESDGIRPHVRGIFDQQGRLIVLINWNTDLGDSWEWADHPEYPGHFSSYAVKLGVNIIIYAMTH